MKQDMIVILDLGGEQSAQIAREVRALGVYSEIHPNDLTAQQLAALPGVRGFILNGGPNNVVDGAALEPSEAVLQSGLPVFAADYDGAPAWPAGDAERKQMLRAFVFDTCKAEANWNMKNFIADQIELVRRQVGDKKVLLALSGGVDSSVAAALMAEAIGNQLTCVFVDHGLMRKNEGDEIEAAFKKWDINFVRVDAEKRFLDKLAGVTDPQTKRHIIGAEFGYVFRDEADRFGITNRDFLAQGTIYPDVIESGEGDAEVIKSHHNRLLPPEVVARFKGVLEPLSLLFKDEVRALGRELGLAESVVMRQPFPGPGLAIRIIGDITKAKADTLREADFIMRDEIAKSGEDKNINQYFAVLTDLHSVGVMGDGRTYDNVLALRAVTTNDFMTAEWARIPYELLDRISTRIVNEVNGINRIVYDITSKPPATVEWE